ncbi:MAG: septal ring lytic transglycosylase RlpA family lipoprotein [Ignavibacteriales bacterium CG12_big_fil_rev_8_21_14_0_65_30_8]|nr:MAG: septal ring lytic transglycosylase RlpA family lipoprotein [Ignavibacteriales bacterium CG12_big_fil_rev_8_21_14_0_65_30_8]
MYLKVYLQFLIIVILFSAGGFKFYDFSYSNEVEINKQYDSFKNGSIDNYSIEPTFEQKGVWTSSWYGPKFHGKLTANGEIYDQMSFTAAHKSIKFGTYFRVTNLKNKKSVIVRINDRGPYIKGRNLDLSKASALALGMIPKGVIKVKIEEVHFNELTSPVM